MSKTFVLTADTKETLQLLIEEWKRFSLQVESVSTDLKDSCPHLTETSSNCGFCKLNKQLGRVNKEMEDFKKMLEFYHKHTPVKKEGS